MSDWAFILAAAVALVCAGYLLVRYEILDVRDVAAGAGLIAAVVLMWRMLTGDPDPVEKPRVEPVEPPTPTPPSQDVDEIIDLSSKQLSEDPPDDIHDRLKEKLRDR